MRQQIRFLAAFLPERLSKRLGRRSAATVLALLLEGLLALVLLTLGSVGSQPEKAQAPLVTFEARPDAEQSPTPPQPKAREPHQAERPPIQPPRPTPPTPSSPPLIPLAREQLAAADIATIPTRPPARAKPSPSQMGPPDTGTPGDTPRVSGSGPNGEPLYAASWYREPYDDELSGYLSTATGPGWGLIACRTAPEYRVEDCVGLDEYPQGSNITRAVLAAAWQFRVRPPRIGGRSMVGEWVRIRIDYGLRR